MAVVVLLGVDERSLAEDVDYSGELPRIAPRSPQEALRSFEIAAGFRVELAAAEPLVVDPVAMAFDAAGRMLVVEMRGYPEQADQQLGRVRLLTDTNGDARFDHSTVFLDNLSWPTAVVCFEGGVFLAAAPDILYCKDLDGDGIADIRRRVFTGFGRGNVQGLVNTLKWGPDQRIHGATSSAGGEVRRVYAPAAEAVHLRGRDFSFDPRRLDIRAESGGGQHGLSFDGWGRKFVSSNSDHLQMLMYEDRYAARNPFLAAPPARVSIAQDGPQAPVFRISPVEPWRIVRTRLRVAKKVPGPIEGGGKPAGYFTGATGVTVVRGPGLGEKSVGMAMIGDVGSNIVHRKRLLPEGVGCTAQRIDEQTEFLASSDIWFRPVQFANGPEGALYIADMYREVIEHPKSLPPAIKKHLDLTSGNDRGRIYRVVATGFQRPNELPLAECSTVELVEAIGSNNGWRRITADRLLYERQDQAAVEPLLELTGDAKLPQSRAQALATLRGLEALSEQVLLAGLADRSPRVREVAVRLSESLAEDSPAIRQKLYVMVDDPDPRVRYQLAFTLGEVSDDQRLDALLALLKRDGSQTYPRFAALSSLPEGQRAMLSRLRSDNQFASSMAGKRVVQELEKMLAAAQRLGDNFQPPQIPSTAAQRSEQEIAEREAVIERYRPALLQTGNPEQGRNVFSKHCAACHRTGELGKAIGPNLAAMRNRGPEAILLAVLDPNREVNPQYLGYQLQTHQGRTYSGMILAETATSLSLLQADGTTLELLRGDLAIIRQSSLSFMPQGLEKSISIEDMVHLLAYLMQPP